MDLLYNSLPFFNLREEPPIQKGAISPLLDSIKSLLISTIFLTLVIQCNLITYKKATPLRYVITPLRYVKKILLLLSGT
jgi:hypothetical protein